MVITDAQVHVWAAESADRPWPDRTGRPPPHGPQFLPEELLGRMDQAGVHRAVLVPPSFEGDRNDVCLEAAARHPDRFRVMGRLSMTDEKARERARHWLEIPGMSGVRLTFGIGASAGWLQDGTCEWFWKIAEEAGIPVMIFPPNLLPYVRDVAARYPGLRLIIDHLAVHPRTKDRDLDPVLAELVELAEFENVAVKATTLPAMVTEGYPFPSLHARIRRVVAAFGAERVFWGSDLTRLTCSYTEAKTLFTEQLTFLNDRQLELIMGEALSEWIGWPAG